MYNMQTQTLPRLMKHQNMLIDRIFSQCNFFAKTPVTSSSFFLLWNFDSAFSPMQYMHPACQ